MSDIKDISLKFSCPEKSSLSKTEGGFNCSKCAKKVIDFRQSSEADLAQALKSGQTICGAFNRSQLSKQFLKYAAAAAFASSSIQLTAQSDSLTTTPLANYRTNDSIETENDIIFGIIETMPQPIGGMEQLYESLKAYLQVPVSLSEAGRVFVQFEVDTTGHINNIKVIKGIDPETDQAALKALQLVNPKFEPGTQRGKAVKVRMVLPIFFDPKK